MPDLNDFHDLHREPYPVGCHAFVDTGFAVAHATWVRMVYDQEEWDPTGSYNPATGVYTCPHNGVYFVSGSCFFEQGNVFSCAEAIYFAPFVNGVLQVYMERKDWHNCSASFFPYVKGSALVLAQKGQTIDLRVHQLSGGSVNVNTGSQVVNHLQILRRGPYNP